MAKYPINRSTGSVPGVSGGVSQSFSTDTGAGAIGQAVRGLGQTAFDVNSVIFRKQGEAELTESMSNANDDISQMFLSFETNQDENTYEEKWNQTFNKIKQREPKNGWARQQYRKAMFNVKDKIGGAVQSSITKRVDDKHDWAVSRMEANAIQSGNIEALRRGLAGFVKSGTMSQEEMAYRMSRAQPAADKRAKEIGAAEFEQAIQQEAAATSMEKALERARKPGIEDGFGLTRGEANSIVSDFETNLRTQKLRKQEQDNETQQKTERDFLTRIWNGSLIDATEITKALANGSLTVPAAKALKKAMDEPIREISDPVAQRKILDAIHAKSMSLREKLDVVTENSHLLKPSDGTKYLEKVYAEWDSEKSSWYEESKRLMAQRIRTKAAFGSGFTDNAQEIEGEAEAVLELNKRVEEGEIRGKPLNHKDYLIQSIDIARRIKSEVEARKADDILSTFGADLKKYETIKAPKGLEDVFDDLNNLEQLNLATGFAQITDETVRQGLIDEVLEIIRQHKLRQAFEQSKPKTENRIESNAPTDR